MTAPILAWHFTKSPDCLRDGTPFQVGVPAEFNAPLVMCEQGLHASIDPFDALMYAPGPYLWRVECGGEIISKDDKLVCSKRMAIAGGDAAEMLRTFARACASDVVHLWDAPDVVKQYLATGEDPAAAYAAYAADAAYAAARAAYAAARAAYAADAAAYAADAAARAAYAAARAAYAAAYAAARAAYAADAAADAAARAAYAAARAAADAAADAAAYAAYAAARDAQRKRFAAMCDDFIQSKTGV